MIGRWSGWHLSALAAALSLGQVSPPRTATGSVAGIVTDSRSQPIDRAIVTLSGGGRPESLTAITKEDGKFEALDVPVGVYHVAVSKPGYAASWMGPTTVDPQGIPLDVDVEQRADLALQLRRGGVITGIVLDEAGDPVSNAFVIAEGPGLAKSPAQPFVGTVNTDAHGRYRFFGLGAGEYVVSVMPGYSSQTVMIGNRATRLRTTFWPATSAWSTARPVTVAEGDEVAGIDVRIVRAPVAPLDVRFSGAQGRIESSLVAVGESRNRSEYPESPNQYMLPAGQWVLTATGNNRSAWAQTTITTDGFSPIVRDIDLQPTGSISGRIIVANGDSAGRRPFLWTTRVGGDISYDSSSNLIGPDATGAFAFRGFTPGRYFVDVMSPDRWIGSLRLGDREVIGPITIDAGEQITDVTLTIGPAPPPSTIKGVLVDAVNQPEAMHAVVLINEDERLWNESCRATLVTQPSIKGRFKFGDLLPGRYRLVTTELRRPDCADVQGLRALVARGLAIELTAGQVRELSLIVK